MNIPTAQHACYVSNLNRQSNQEYAVGSSIRKAIGLGCKFCECWCDFDPTEVVEKLQAQGYTVDVEKWQIHHGSIHKHHHSLLSIYWGNK